MTAFATAAAVLHADRNLSEAATYTPPGVGAVAVPCRVILSEREEMAAGFQTGSVARSTVGTLRLADVPAPVEGATLAVGARAWLVRTVARDIEGETVTLTLRAQA